jgi:hypothetical protein
MNINNFIMGRETKSNQAMMPEYLRGNVRSGRNESNRLIDIYVDGISAEAKILSIDEAGVFAGRVYYHIGLEVRPMHTKKFRTRGFAPVSGSLIPKPGDIITIKYNAADQEKFVII